MLQSRRLLTSAVLTMALAAPSLVLAQASRRGGDSGGSSGGSSGGRTSSEPSGGTAQPRSAPQPTYQPPSSERNPSSSPSEGSRVTRRPSGVRSEGGPTSRSEAAQASAASRARGAQAVRGTAEPRSEFNRPDRGGDNNYYAYPWRSYGYYNPWYYGASYWGWNRYGYGYSYWHSPYLYDPYGYYGSSYPYYWGGGYVGSNRDRDDRREEDPSGAIRLRVNPRSAKVYVDGALAGIVDEFDGLSSHLRLPAGRHEIELRADGYENLTLAVNVDEGKTRTERATLKKR